MLVSAVIFLAAAIVAVPAFKRLGLGSVLGYLAAGVAIGPSGLGLIGDVGETLHFAELGVVFLLFIIGLELQPSRLWAMRRAVFVFGGAQVAVTACAIAGIAMALGTTWRVAIVLGLALALSSTAFAMQILAEKDELKLPHGRSAFGILLFQDLVTIPILALVPLLGTPVAESEMSGWTQAALIVGVLLGLGVLGRFAVRPAFRFIMQAKSPELSIAAALFVVVGTALAMEAVGLSMALGAFVAGVLLADSEYRHELEASIEPFKGLLLGLFFIAVGMSASLRVLVDHPLEIVGLALGLTALKLIILVGLARAAGHGRRAAGSLGVAISQGGEFAFVIFAVATQSRVMESATVEMMIMVVTLSMVLTPLLFALRDRIAARFGREAQKPYDAIDEHESPVLIAGYGRFGQMVGRVLRAKRIPFTALDVDAEHVELVRRFGNKSFYGDASRLELLRAAGAEEARVFVLAIDDPETSVRALQTVKEHFPHLAIIARARNRPHAFALLDQEVDVVIRETFAASMEAARETLRALGHPDAVARQVVERFAAHDERSVRESYMHRGDEAKLIQTAQQISAELERVLEQDERAALER